ncbi:hypothetical protein PENVUL_c001G08898 [Penicillium vulpinum]|uniref:O-methyltransferase domain-containing protein n=1 Tax=Penicillium vulpinum TaxID=29845 RepID=A0A1V6SEV2_9EURO|nr:hypothetical protein PENVUL_c001G08898 [Penicillium vulpinum]
MSTTEEWIQEFEALCSRASTLFSSGTEDEAVRTRALHLAEKAVHQLHTPMTFADAQTWGPLELFGTGVACEMGIFDLLSKHSGSLSTADIAKELDADPGLVARIMRLLDAHYMVDQISLGQYAANAITRDYVQPYRKGNVMTQVGLMPSYFALPTWLRENNYKVIPDANHCGWQVGANTTKSFWESMSDDPRLSKYFNDYMTIPRITEEENLVHVYPFETIFANSTADDILFVDIAGGLGHQAMRVRNAFPRSRGRIILQDLLQVTSKITAASLPDVEIMDHDLSYPQPIKGAYIYYLRSVLHNHADHMVVQYLSRIAAAMGPESRVLIHEALMTDVNPAKNITRYDLKGIVGEGRVGGIRDNDLAEKLANYGGQIEERVEERGFISL